MFKKVNPRQNFPEMEKEIIKFWEENKIFEKSVDSRGGLRPAPIYSFYDGPPFATGLPHYGHIVANLIKDVAPRYWTMRGYKVERRWGWDCHGLPVENLIEKERQIKNKQEIEEMGIDKFNEACRASVLRYADEWKKFIPRIGRWVDMENDYRTMDWKYTESIWWVFSELYKKGLIYESYKSMHLCPRCETTLSNFEVTQGYKDITDISATVKFKLKAGQKVGDFEVGDNTFVLAWTTTPWTLPGNAALAVGNSIKYQVVSIKGENERYLLAKDRVNEIFKDKEFEILNEIDGKELIGLEYEPLFDYYLDKNEKLLNTAGDGKNTVEVVVIDKKDRILLGLRGYSKNFKGEKDRWIVPRGRSEIGENLENTIRREIKEECNIYEYEIVKYLGSGNGYRQGDIVNWFLIKLNNLEQIKNNEPEKFAEWKFFDLKDVPLDMTYDGDFNYYQKAIKENNAYKIYAGDFVTTEEGTGIVHIAPAFGDDDMKLGEKHNLPFIQHVKSDGRFADEVADFRKVKKVPQPCGTMEPADEKIDLQKGSTALRDYGTSGIGREVKPKRNPRETDEIIVKWLEENNKLFSKENYKHSYPHCWRCDTPLLNYAASSWFVKVTEIKDKMVKNNQEVSWMPEYIKNGRFGKWLEGARDWAISRSRYWGAPLPIWKCGDGNKDKTSDKINEINKKESRIKNQESGGCGNLVVVNSIDDLRSRTDQKITKFILLRHGESESNVLEIRASESNKYSLTKKGIKQSEAAAEELKNQKIDVLITSPILRARQTAEIVNKKLKMDIIENDLVREYNFGKWNGCSEKDLIDKDDLYDKHIKLDHGEERYNLAFGGDGESRQDVENRIRKFTDECAQKYPGKNILVVCHGGVNAIFNRVLNGVSMEKVFKIEPLFKNAEQSVFYADEKGEKFDLHKPNIDKVKIKCPKCGGEAKIIGDVFDCWFESGAMPYAQWHYPFENQDKFKKSFPADFIAEGLDQTRGWFYTLMVLSTALFDKPAFKNVIVNGIVLAENGQKMSKRLKNYPDPNLIIEKYGADALRYYLLFSPVMKAENLNFSERGVEEVLKKFILTLWNVYSFLAMNTTSLTSPMVRRGENFLSCEGGTGGGQSGNLLDRWILSELNILIKEVNKQMQSYDLVKAARPLREFVDKLSNWYLRRSRKRFVSDDLENRNSAFQTLYYILITYSKLLAPFTPFLAEEIYKNLTDEESVHLADYPQADKKLINKELSDSMNFVRQIVTLGLAARAKNSLKVRQPLRNLEIGKLGNWEIGNSVPPLLKGARGISELEIKSELLNLIKDELNVKKIEFVDKLTEKSEWVYEEDEKIKIGLDTRITDELRREGYARELTRHIQAMRKEAKYNREDIISVKYNFAGENKDIEKVFSEWGDYLKKECLVKSIEFVDELVERKFDLARELKLGDWKLEIGIGKVL